MPRWHWIYRDFLASVEGESDDDWTQSFKQYLKRNWNLLYEIHFSIKGFESHELVRERCQSLDRDKYTVLADLNNSSVFESSIVSMADKLFKRLDYEADDHDVYVIFGLDCTNIYATVYQGRPVTVLCLEVTSGDLKEIELLLAHEAHHWKRQSLLSHNIFDASVHERCVTEGLAICFSEEVQPGRPIHECCFVPPDTVTWVQSHMDEMEEWIRTVEPCDSHAMSALFSRRPDGMPIPGMPPRTGYVYGYLLAKSLLSRTRTSAVEMAGANYEILFKRGERKW